MGIKKLHPGVARDVWFLLGYKGTDKLDHEVIQYRPQQKLHSNEGRNVRLLAYNGNDILDHKVIGNFLLAQFDPY